MKNIFLLIPLFFAFNIQTEQNKITENGLELVMAHYKTTPFDLDFWQHARIIAASSVFSAGTWLATRAIVNILQPKIRTLNLLDVKSWSLPEKIVTLAAFAAFAKISFDEQTPEGIAYNANKNGLLNSLLTCSTQEEIKSTLDCAFVSEILPRSAAFAELNTIRDALKKILNLINTIQASNPNKNFNYIAETISTNINVVESTLLLIKSDPQWIEECNASRLSQMQATQQAHFNANLAGSAVQLAHVYAR